MLLVGIFPAVAAAEAVVPYVFRLSDLTGELSQVSARQIYQDSRGFLWILTQEGLNRYDGKENRVFRTDANNPGAISHNVPRGVVEDEAGNLWFGTDGGGLNRFVANNESFENIRKSPDSTSSPYSDRIWSVTKGIKGRIWLGYKGGGVSVFDPKSRLFRHYTSHRYPVISEHPVLDVFEESDGTVWIATGGNGLLRLDLSTETLVKAGGVGHPELRLPSDNLSDIFRDSSGNFWVAAWNGGTVRIDARSNTSRIILGETRAGAEPGENPFGYGVSQVIEDHYGTIFLTTTAGLGVVDSSSLQLNKLPLENNDADAPRLYAMLQDRSGVYWVGGYRGVYSGFRSNFYLADARSGLEDENVLAIASSTGGTAWVGTTNGLYRLPAGEPPRKVARPVRLPVADAESTDAAITDSPVTSLLAEGDRLWVGTFDSGLQLFDTSSEPLTALPYAAGRPDSLSSNQITAMYRDSFGNLWVGTFGGGLNLQRRGEDAFVHYQSDAGDPSSLSSDNVYAIYQERNGDLWVGTESGLNRFNYDVGDFDRFNHDKDKPGSLSSDNIYSIYEDSKARLWIGTQGGGLNMWEPLDRKSSIGKFHYFQSNIELPSSTVYAIQGDQQDNLWLSTTGGITRYNVDQGKYKHYTAKDGLQGNDFNLGASFRDRQGRIYFGGASGLNAFYPDRVRDNQVEPLLAITRISLQNEQAWFDEPYGDLKNLDLGPQDYMLGFAFTALDFSAPLKNRYRYQMVGLNKNWVDLGNRNTVDFTNLPTGRYVFRVQGSNADGVWNQKGVALSIVVHPPFFMTWWAFAVYISSFLMTVLYVITKQRQKEQMQLQYQSQLESDVRARTRDLRRANDKLQSAVDEIGMARSEAVEANQAKSEFLAALSHEIRTPMHGVLGMTDLLLHSGLTDRQEGFAETAHESATELLSLIDNILDFSKIEAGKLELEETTFNLREIAENLCYLYGDLAQNKNLELNLIFNADLGRQLYGDPVRIRQILQNLLSNAIKFTKRGSVTVMVEEMAREGSDLRLRLSVEDTGIGMSEQALQRIFEAFSQADSSTTRQYGGTGLGLSIAKQLVELMNGDLAVSSKSGVGTVMSVQLVLTESPIYTDKLSTSALEGFYAEVVAPMPETRAMLRSQLESLSLQTRECASVEELGVQADHQRVVLIDVGCLYDNATIAQVKNLQEDEHTILLLVAPLSLQGIPEELQHAFVTTKPTRISALINDILAAMSKGLAENRVLGSSPMLHFNQRILLVEDMTANQEIARAMLESFGCSVDIAKNGAVALDMVQQERYDIVLMDCQMPVMDGFEATRHIRQLEAQKKGSVRTPIVALTAGKTEVEKERCYVSGMDRILFKPYSTAELNHILSQYFSALGEIEVVKTPVAGREASGEILDVKALDNIRSVDAGSGNDLLASVFEHFKRDVRIKLDELRANPGDADVLGAGAHAVKSMSLNMGAKALSEYCRAREADWKSQRTDDAKREIEVMHGHFLDAVRALEQLIEPWQETID